MREGLSSFVASVKKPFTFTDGIIYEHFMKTYVQSNGVASLEIRLELIF